HERGCPWTHASGQRWLLPTNPITPRIRTPPTSSGSNPHRSPWSPPTTVISKPPGNSVCAPSSFAARLNTALARRVTSSPPVPGTSSPRTSWTSPIRSADPATTSCDEDAERVAIRIREDVERLILVVGAVEQQFGTQVFGPLTLPLKLGSARDSEVEMHLHGDLCPRPGSRFEIIDLLEGQLSAPATVGEHEPIRFLGVVARTLLGTRVRCPAGGRFITGAIGVAEQLSIEFGRPPRRGCIDDRVQQFGIFRHLRRPLGRESAV